MKIALLIIALFFVFCVKSNDFRDYNCRNGFQDEYYKCLKERPKDYSLNYWEMRCRDLAISSHCGRVNSEEF